MLTVLALRNQHQVLSLKKNDFKPKTYWNDFHVSK